MNNEPETTTIEAKVTFTREEILDRVAEKALRNAFYDYYKEAAGFKDEVKAVARHEIAKHVADWIQEDARAVSKGILEDLVANGLPRYSQYGEDAGTTTVRQAVLEGLGALSKPGDRYGRDNWFAEVAKKAFSEEIRKAITEEVEHIRKAVREKFDDAITGDLAKAIRDGLGLRA